MVWNDRSVPGRIGALARANNGTNLAACQVSFPDDDMGGESLAAIELSRVPLALGRRCVG